MGLNLDEELRRRREILERLKKGPRSWELTQATEDDLRESQLDGTAYDDISSDDRYADAENETLSKLQEISRNGYTAEEAAAMARARSEANRDDASRRASILQQMQMRGGGGGGAELAAQLASADAAAERESQASLDAAAAGQRRQLQALLNRGEMAGRMSQRRFDQQSRQAEARDRLNQFNARVAGEFARERVNNANQAAQWNAGQGNDWNMRTSELDYTDATQNMNRKLAEEAERKKRKLQKQQAIGGLLGGVAGGVGGFFAGGPMGASAGAGAGQSLGSNLGTIFSDEKLKKDIEGAEGSDFDDFMKTIDPKTFKYKQGGPASILAELLEDGPHKKRVGVMAQDIEESPIGAVIVEETPHGKVLDTQNLIGAMLGSIKRLDEKKRNK